MLFIKNYAAKEAELLLWFGHWTFRNILARVFAGAKFFHTSMLSVDPATGVCYNYEQNMDMMSETPTALKEVVRNSPYKYLVLSPKFDVMRAQLEKAGNFKSKFPGVERSKPLPKRITSAMKEIMWFRYNNIDVIRAILNKYRKSVKIAGCSLDKNGVEILYYYKERGQPANEWTLSADKRNTFTCSGAVASAFALNGIQLFNRLPWFVLPDDFAKSGYFDVLGYIDKSTNIIN